MAQKTDVAPDDKLIAARNKHLEGAIQQIAKEYDVHPVQVSDWKKAVQEKMGSLFEKGAGGGGQQQQDFEAERAKLHAKIGELTVHVDFLMEKSKQLGL